MFNVINLYSKVCLLELLYYFPFFSILFVLLCVGLATLNLLKLKLMKFYH